MAWRQSNVEDQRRKFIELFLSETHSIQALCRFFEISRPTAYKWIARYEELGWAGLEDLSREPHSHPNETPAHIKDRILQIRGENPYWGARKILTVLKRYCPEDQCPSDTTINNILAREGLILPRRVRRRVSPQTAPLGTCTACNTIWSADFKGTITCGDGQTCSPFTVTDNHSRYLIVCTVLARNDTGHVWPHLDRAFREFGLPEYIRSDNGPPFGSTGAGRLCKLAIKLIKAGVYPEWITPGKPQENGRHERMHRTLKLEGATPPSKTLKDQCNRLVNFRDNFNHIRPHAALNQETPASRYQRSLREWNGIFKSPEYDEGFSVHTVRSCGKACINGGDVYIGRVLAEEPIALKVNEEGMYEVYYGKIPLGTLSRDGRLIRPKGKLF